MTTLFSLSAYAASCGVADPEGFARRCDLLREIIVETNRTMKVLCPRERSSAAPTRVKIRSTSPISIDSAGTNEPIWASTTRSAVWRM